MIEQTSAVLSGEIPVVIVNGRAKANPSAEDVVAECDAAPDPRSA